MKYSYDEKCLDLARHFFPTQSIAFLEALAQEFQDCVEGREDDADVRTLPIPDFLRNQDNLRAERAEKETRPVPEDRWIKHDPRGPVPEVIERGVEWYRKHGHGHVVPRDDGMKARCGGPTMCKLCALEQIATNQGESEPVEG